MKKTLRSLAIAGLLSTVATRPAQAAPIIYIGSQQVGSILANYSIETDGTIGVDTAQNVLAFSVTLSNMLSSTTFTNATGGKAGGSFTATATELTLSSTDSVLEFYHMPPGGRLFDGFLSFYTPSLSNQSVVNVQFSGGSYGAPFTNPIATAVTTSTPAVPEPATWAMMMAGFGMIGLTVRGRRQVKTRVRFI